MTSFDTQQTVIPQLSWLYGGSRDTPYPHSIEEVCESDDWSFVGVIAVPPQITVHNAETKYDRVWEVDIARAYIVPEWAEMVPQFDRVALLSPDHQACFVLPFVEWKGEAQEHDCEAARVQMRLNWYVFSDTVISVEFDTTDSFLYVIEDVSDEEYAAAMEERRAHEVVA